MARSVALASLRRLRTAGRVTTRTGDEVVAADLLRVHPAHSMSERQILLAIGTRPEAIKLAPVALALRRESWAAVRILSTSQHRHLVQPALASFGIAVDRDLDVMRRGQSLVALCGRLMLALDPAIVQERPDIAIVQGDTTTAFAVAFACASHRVPVVHIEAGLRSGDRGQPFPEEHNRELITRVAARHYAPTESARQNLLREGIADASIAVVGNPVVDALRLQEGVVDASTFASTDGRRLVVVTAHRRENFGEPLRRICRAVRALADRPDVAVLFPTHLNPEARRVAEQELGSHRHVRLVEPLDYPHMVAALRACAFVMTDSGGLQEEAPALGKPVLVLRNVTERPEGVACGAARIVGTDEARIVAAAASLLDDHVAYAAMAQVRHPYGAGDAAKKVVDDMRLRFADG